MHSPLTDQVLLLNHSWLMLSCSILALKHYIGKQLVLYNVLRLQQEVEKSQGDQLWNWWKYIMWKGDSDKNSLFLRGGR